MPSTSLLTRARARANAVFDKVEPFDEAVDKALQPLRGNPVADEVFYHASEWADYSRLWHAVGLTMAVLQPAKRPDALRLALSLGAESALVNGLIKRSLPRERPTMLDRDKEVRRPKTTSFPSGHASSATMAAVLLSDSLPRFRPLWWSAAAVVSVSRIYNRMHHGSDVVAGSAIGYALGRIVLRLWPLR